MHINYYSLHWFYTSCMCSALLTVVQVKFPIVKPKSGRFASPSLHTVHVCTHTFICYWNTLPCCLCTNCYMHPLLKIQCCICLLWQTFMVDFVTKAMPIHSIDNKFHIKGMAFVQLISTALFCVTTYTLLVNSLESRHTYIYTHAEFMGKSDFKKVGVCWPIAIVK